MLHTPTRPIHPAKSTGAYYTPAKLVDLLLDHALPALAIESPRVLDPACGPGDFLKAIRTRLPRAELFGVDVDAAAVKRCRAAITCELAEPQRVVVADALLDPPAFLCQRGFDLVVGNPPFVNGIQGLVSDARKARLRAAFPNVGGVADLAHYFLEQATQLVRPGGRIALVLPRAILNSSAAGAIRAALPSHLRPNLIYAPERSDFFPGATVFICLLILGPEPTCRFSADPDPPAAQFTTAAVESHNWWLALRGALDGSCVELSDAPLLATRFDVSASMIASDAYHLRAFLVDQADAPGLKLVTTGLIEPRDCLWGRQACRYLRERYHYPRVSLAANAPTSLHARIAKARRPKILLAGLARKIEAFLDPAGQHIGAVSTYSIYHPHDDLNELGRLLDHLLDPQATQRFIRHLGGNGLRGRHITGEKVVPQRAPTVVGLY